MAEGLLRDRLAGSIPKLQVSSAGLAALVGHPADAMAQEVMRENTGINMDAHRARQISMDILTQVDLILVMEAAHQKQIQFKFPAVYGKVHRLGKWSDFDIPDPYRQPRSAFLHSFMLIEQGIKEWQTRLWK